MLFRYEDTEGKELLEVNYATKQIPSLYEVAERFEIDDSIWRENKKIASPGVFTKNAHHSYSKLLMKQQLVYEFAVVHRKR